MSWSQTKKAIPKAALTKSRAKEWRASWASAEQTTPWSSAVLDAPGEVS